MALMRGLLTAFAAEVVTAASVGAVNVPKCGIKTGVEGGQTMNVTDGTYDRCISVITPPSAQQPMPVLFWFHGAGGNAGRCGQKMGRQAESYGFALVCGEALQDLYGKGGQWTIPEVQTDSTGTKCGSGDSPDIAYMKNAVAALSQSPELYDTRRLFFSGCSFGSAFSNYAANCWKELHPKHVSAFATHSTGLKVKGDGNKWPRDIYHAEYVTAECPACQYFPIVPKAYSDTLGLKACIFDNTEDPSEADPYFYRSSIALAGNWTALGGIAETHFASGGHCNIHSFDDIVTCLDDGTGRLFGNKLLV